MALIGGLITPYVYSATDVDHVSSPVAGRFPTPPSAWGYITAPGDFSVEAVDVAGLAYPIAGALEAEGKYMEPTIGQIWPR